MSEVIVLSGAYQPTGTYTVEKAICLIYLGKAYSIKNSDKVVRSPSMEIPIPIAIVVPDGKYIKTKETTYSARLVKKRDGYKCVYCGDNERANLSIDHVIPKTRWKEISEKLGLAYKLNSFENCVTACKKCNQKKSDKLLSELGWADVTPRKPLSSMDIDWDQLLS